MRKTPTAARLTRTAEEFLGGAVPVRVRAWDGSEAGPPPSPGDPVVVVRTPRALRRLLWQPGELGLAHAYVAGDLDIEGDLGEGLRRSWEAFDRTGARRRAPGWRSGLRALGTCTVLRAVGPRPRPPVPGPRLRGRRHSRRRDQAAIAHHYDLSNDFYTLLLDSRMTYSCGYWPSAGSAHGLEDAQEAKLDLVCRKLGLGPSSRLLDVGCGWGALALHAATRYGTKVTAVTLSGEQRDYVEKQARKLGAAGDVDVRLQHYRDLEVTGMDAVASLEMGEHVGRGEYAHFARTLHDCLRPGGRVLVQQMSRGVHAPGGGAFIETYIAPDMHMRPVQHTVGLLAGAGLEVRHVEAMREHYPRTVRAWAQRLEDRWDEAVALVGEQTARVWRLYLAGGALAFAQNRMGVDQLLLVRPDAAGRSAMPESPAAWAPPAWTPTAWTLAGGTG